MTKGIKKIIVKYLTNSATAEDLDILTKWVETPENKRVFKEYVQTHFIINHIVNKPSAEDTLKKLLRAIQKDKAPAPKIIRLPIFRYTAVASIILIVFSTIFFNKKEATKLVEPTIVNTPIEPGTNKAILTLENGTNVALEKDTPFQTERISSNGEEIVYAKTNNKEASKVSYNYLTIPRGGLFNITLSDGTKVWLNSETKLKYPVAFIDGKTRNVELIYGEAYFDVSPSSNHKGAGFQVYQNEQIVNVIGTKFNIKAYKNDSDIYTTLVEGKVSINTSVSNKVLVPNQQSKFNRINKTIKTITVNATNEIGWIQGDLIFKRKSLKSIMSILSRWYDVDIVFENKEAGEITFTGELNKYQTLEEILSLIKNTSTITAYEIKDKTIIIK